MSMFSRQPPLPPDRPASPRGQAVPVGVATPQVLAQFAVVGVDQKTGQPVSTVIEARSENEAQELAQQQGIIVDEFKPMHPLAGAAAVQMARSDPKDRFNQHAGHAENAQSLQNTRAAAQAAAEQDESQRPLMTGPGGGPDVPGMVRKPQTSSLGVLAVLGVIAVMGGVLYTSLFKDGGVREVMAALTPGPQSVEASINVDQPVNVDLSAIQGFDDWQYVSDLEPTPTTPTFSDKIRLEAIIPPTRNGGGHRGSAVIGGQIIRPGQEIAGYRLVLVRDKHVLLQKGDRLVALRMGKDGG